MMKKMGYVKPTRIFTLAIIFSLIATLLPSTTVLAADETLWIYPTEGEIGTEIEIAGTDFTATLDYDLYFSSERASVGEEIDEEVLNYEFIDTVEIDGDGTFTDVYFEIPSWLRDGDEDEKVTGGTYYIYATVENDEDIVDRISFTVEAVASITSISPSSGKIGSKVEIDGEGYDASEDLIIEFDGSSVSITDGDSSTDSSGSFDNATIVIPESAAGEHTITVAGDDSGLEDETTFTVIPDMTVSPDSGASGTLITVTGNGFAASSDVNIYFNNTQVAQTDTDSDGGFTVTFEAPVIAEGIYVIEAVDEDSNSDDGDFSVGTASITLVPNEGNIGDTVAVTGTGFIANTEVIVTFATSVVATATSDSGGGISTSFTVPSDATVGDYGVVADDGTNAAGKRFNITTSSSISPVTSATSPGNVGSKVTVSGMGFTPSGAVIVTYDGTQIATTTVSAAGDFMVSFNVPASKSGSHTIVATQGTNTKTFTFYMESTAPAIPSPLLPAAATKADAEAYFDWEDVTDPSGISYTLQIATDENFTEPLVLEKTGITESQYTLTTEERLNSVSKDAPYYWRVKAMDNASNDSGWSTTGTFYVGFSFGLSQAWIYVIIGICAVLLAVFAFWMGRKTAYY